MQEGGKSVTLAAARCINSTVLKGEDIGLYDLTAENVPDPA